MNAPIAQWIRALACGAKGRWFESSWAHHVINFLGRNLNVADALGGLAEWSMALVSKTNG